MTRGGDADMDAPSDSKESSYSLICHSSKGSVLKKYNTRFVTLLHLE
jgi:hypothetical protein